MSLVRYDADNIPPITEERQKELEKLARKPDSEIDYSDIPPLDEDFFKRAKVGVFYRPIKSPVTMRIDKDVLGWLRSKGAGYQTRANQILRNAMLEEQQSKNPELPKT